MIGVELADGTLEVDLLIRAERSTALEAEATSLHTYGKQGSIRIAETKIKERKRKGDITYGMEPPRTKARLARSARLEGVNGIIRSILTSGIHNHIKTKECPGRLLCS